MKKRSVSNNETSSRHSLRRQTRSNNSSKSATEAEDESVQKRHRAKQVLPDIKEKESPSKKSPEIYSRVRKNQDSTCHEDTTCQATPKSKRSIPFCNGTPLHDDILLASQGDTQADVRWDCTSPDALRFLRRGRRQHHSSDVAHIVQLLVPEEVDGEDAGTSRNTPPLLGLWLNSKPQDRHTDSSHNNASDLGRFRKKGRARSNANRDAKMPAELIQKLRHAVEKCESELVELSDVNETYRQTRDETKVPDFDQSKDLFASTEVNQAQSCQKAMMVDRTDSQQNQGDTTEQATDGLSSDVCWSDEEIFQNDSFLIKASQEPGPTSKETLTHQRGSKRKCYGEKSEEPQSKLNKLNVDTGRHGNVKTSPAAVKGPATVTASFGERAPSPFRKVKSFNDIDKVQANNKNDVKITHGTNRTCLSLRNKESVRRMTQSMTNITANVHSAAGISSVSSIQGRNTTALSSSSLSTASNRTSARPSVSSTAQTLAVSTASNTRPCDSSTAQTWAVSTASNTRPCDSSTVQTWAVSTGSNRSSTRPRSTTQSSAGTENSRTLNPSVPTKSTVCTNSNNVISNVNISSRTYIIAKHPNTVTDTHALQNKQNCGASVTDTQTGQNSQSSGTTILTSRSEVNNKNVNTIVKSKSPTVSVAPSGRRQSSGVFDTSLSDDLLCQLAEPDELLDSQVSHAVPIDSINPSVPSRTDQCVSAQGKPLQSAFNVKSTSSVPCDGPGLTNSACSIKGTMKPGLANVEQPGSTEKGDCGDEQSPIPSGTAGQTTRDPSVGTQSKCGTDDVISQTSGGMSTHRSKFTFRSRSVHIKEDLTTVKPVPVATSAKPKSVVLVNRTKPQSAVSSTGVKPKSVVVASSVMKPVPAVVASSVKPVLAVVVSPVLRSASVLNQQSATVRASEHAVVDNSEDLFVSDDENGLSEEQILAVLDSVELEATEMPDTAVVGTHSQTSSSSALSKCSLTEIEKKKRAAQEKLQKKKSSSPETSPTNLTPTKQSPSKYTSDDIERKRLVAMEKRRVKTVMSSPELKQDDEARKAETAVETRGHSGQVISPSSPAKYNQEEIARKRQAAVEKRKRKEEMAKSESGKTSDSRNCSSPGKCITDEIEKKKMVAIERRKHTSGEISNVCDQSDYSPGMSSSQSAESSPFKCTPDEIEKKKLAALEKLRVKKNLSSQLSNKRCIPKR